MSAPVVSASLPFVGSIGAGIVSAVTSAIGSGIVSLSAWALGGLTHAATATTTPQLSTWFQGPWRAMLAVGAVVAVPLFLVGVLSALVRGGGPSGVARVLGRLLGAVAGVVLALGLVQLALVLVDYCCHVVEDGSGVSLAAALSRIGLALGIAGGPGGAAGIAAVLLALLAGICALVLWLELALRSALIVLGTAFLPLGLAGLLWPASATWLRRMAESLGAVIASKLVIVVVLVLGAAALSASPISLGTPGADVDSMVEAIAFLALATFGLPIALRFVPLAAEASLHAGSARAALRSVGNAPLRAESHVATASYFLRRLDGGVGAPSPSNPPPGGKQPSGGESA